MVPCMIWAGMSLCHFYHILSVRSKSLSPDQAQGEETKLYLLQGGVSTTSCTDLKTTWLHSTPVRGPFLLIPVFFGSNHIHPLSLPGSVRTLSFGSLRPLTANQGVPTAHQRPGGFRCGNLTLYKHRPGIQWALYKYLSSPPISLRALP